MRLLTLSGRILYSDRLGIVLAPVMSKNLASMCSSSSLFHVAGSLHRWLAGWRLRCALTGRIIVVILGKIMIVLVRDGRWGSSLFRLLL